jgi:TolA-binding protein
LFFCFSGKDGKDKGGSSSSESEDGKDDNKSSAMERKLTNMRRNIREVMSESQLDEETLAAQRQEMERIRRVQGSSGLYERSFGFIYLDMPLLNGHCVYSADHITC